MCVNACVCARLQGNFNFQFSLVNSESFSSVLEKGQALFQIVKVRALPMPRWLFL